MIEGTLMANLEPPRYGFSYKDAGRRFQAWRPCSVEELKEFLLAFDAINLEQRWPPRDYLLLKPGHFSVSELHRFGLIALPPANNKASGNLS